MCGTRHPFAGDPLHVCTEVSSTELPTSWILLKQESWPCTFVHERLKWTLFHQSPPTSETECLCVDVEVYKIVNVYTPPPIRLQISDLPLFPHPCVYAGLFNCQHVDWDYDANSADGKCLVGWASTNSLALFHNP